MGYAFNLTIPASGGGSRPINVSGATQITATQTIEVAYDENGFNTGQYTRIDPVASPQVLNFSTSGKTVLWIRQPPADAAPSFLLYVWSDISGVNL